MESEDDGNDFYVPLNSTHFNRLDNYVNTYSYTFYVLMWRILAPGDEQIETLKFPRKDTIRGIIAISLFFVYQFIIVIVMLNVFIAVMNAAMQKVSDKQQLYWKFFRTRLIIEYFDDFNAIPVPFSIINIPTSLFQGIVHIIKYCKMLYKKDDIYKINRANSTINKLNNPCLFNEDEMDNRKQHAKLMLKLLQRYSSSLQHVKNGSNKKVSP